MGDVIGQAESALSLRYGLDTHEAHALLVEIAQQQNRSLDTVALAAVERRGPRLGGGAAGYRINVEHTSIERWG